MTLFDDDLPDDDEPLPDPVDPTVQRATGHAHPDTSREAARNNTVTFASERGKVLDAIAASGLRGMTAAECTEQCALRSRNQTAIALLELRKLGWIERVTSRITRPVYGDEVVKGDGFFARATGPHSEGVVHVLTPQGRMDYARREDRRGKEKG